MVFHSPRKAIAYYRQSREIIPCGFDTPSSLITAMSSNSNRTLGLSGSTNNTSATNRLSTVPSSASKARQLSHLHAQLAQLTAHMSDLENLLRMTAVQAEGMRGLGGYAGGMFMAASKVLGEETVNGGPAGAPGGERK